MECEWVASGIRTEFNSILIVINKKWKQKKYIYVRVCFCIRFELMMVSMISLTVLLLKNKSKSLDYKNVHRSHLEFVVHTTFYSSKKTWILNLLTADQRNSEGNKLKWVLVGSWIMQWRDYLSKLCKWEWEPKR